MDPSDLRPVWNWNVKMLFVYVTAEYATDKHVSSLLFLHCAEEAHLFAADKSSDNL